jgi:hypothetical protein
VKTRMQQNLEYEKMASLPAANNGKNTCHSYYYFSNLS